MSAARLSLLSLVCVVAFALTGCSPAQQIVGTWDLDTSKALGSELQAANPALAAFVPLLQPKVQITFEGNGNYAVKGTFGPQSLEKKGSWRYVKMDGKALVLMVKEAGKTDEDELRFTLTDADHAEMSVPMNVGGKTMNPSMPFVRVKPAS
jgi:VCBS repeat-containing protein